MPAGLRIALVVDHFLPRVGGIELHVADLARQLVARGHDVQVISTTPGEDSFDQIAIRRLSGPLLPHFQILCHARPVRELRALLERERFDVVHCHSSIVSPLAYAATWHCRQLQMPSVLTTHSLLGPHQFVFGAVNRGLDLYGWPTSLTTVSRATAEGLRRMSGRNDVAILANGIEASRWQIEPIDKPELRVTSVMRLNIKKRPHDLVAAIPHILQKLPADCRPVFTLVGDGPFRQKLERQVRSLGLTGVVEFRGFQPRSEIKEIFRRTDLFVLPTVLEAFGIAVLEARCAGLPIVAMRHSGVSDVIDHGRHGLLAEDSRQFADYIAQLLADKPQRRQMALAARQGLQKFGWDQVIADHVAVYADAMAHYHTPQPVRVSA
jgi:glycosyltransferase involved in cell wall biosynthesis